MQQLQHHCDMLITCLTFDILGYQKWTDTFSRNVSFSCLVPSYESNNSLLHPRESFLLLVRLANIASAARLSLYSINITYNISTRYNISIFLIGQRWLIFSQYAHFQFLNLDHYYIFDLSSVQHIYLLRTQKILCCLISLSPTAQNHMCFILCLHL